MNHFKTRWVATGFLLAVLVGKYTSAHAASADSLPAFKSDSASQDPFRQVESGRTPFGGPAAQPGATGVPGAPGSPNVPVKADTSSAHNDSVTVKIRQRLPGLAIYAGVDFIDLSAKDLFARQVDSTNRRDSLTLLQAYEPVHLAFPIGLQLQWPISDYLDWVAKTASYWYQQTAIVGKTVVGGASTTSGSEFFAVQGNLAGTGLRYLIPPSLLSVKDQLGLYIQGLWYWNLGNSEIYTRYGSAPAQFDPAGSGFEVLLGFEQAVTKSWEISGTLGFVHQQFHTHTPWKNLLPDVAESGDAHWTISSMHAALLLWYRFGFKPPAAPAAAISNVAGSSTTTTSPPATSAAATATGAGSPTQPTSTSAASSAPAAGTLAPTGPAPTATPGAAPIRADSCHSIVEKKPLPAASDSTRSK